MADNAVVARVTHRFAASAERVFNAWLDPRQVEVWGAAAERQGPRGEMVRVCIDARVGGSFSWQVRRGGALVEHVGTYLEIERPRRLVFTWAVAGHGDETPSKVTIEITPLGTGCEVALTHEMDPKWKDFVERAAAAWSLMLRYIAEALG